MSARRTCPYCGEESLEFIVQAWRCINNACSAYWQEQR